MQFATIGGIYFGLILNGYPEEIPFIASHLGYSLADIHKFQLNYNTWINTKNSSNAYINQNPAGVFGKCP